MFEKTSKCFIIDVLKFYDENSKILEIHAFNVHYLKKWSGSSYLILT